jgi:hypothetical protein
LKEQFCKPRIGNDKTLYLLLDDFVDHLGGIVARPHSVCRKIRSGAKGCIEAKFEPEEIQQTQTE